MTILVLVVAIITLTVVSVVFIQNHDYRTTNQLLLLLCESGQKNLDYYFTSTQKSVSKVASYVMADMDGLDDEHLENHINRVRTYFDQTASKTNGVLTYYYRIDPAISQNVKGFWYTNLDSQGFMEHTVTDISEYDTEDTSQLVWFTVPKKEGVPKWLPPYITENLDKRVISYNVPVYYKDTFVGVVGIEIDYSLMAEQVDNIRVLNDGYAFLSDAEANLFYHPRIDLSQLSEDEYPSVPDGALTESTFIRYTFEGVEKIGAWMPLSNGMRMNVVVPATEVEGGWQQLIWNILIVGVEAAVAASIFTMLYTKRIVGPLEQLTKAAEQVDKGNYEFSLEYNKDDEVGRLTNTFKLLTDHMQDNITNLNKKVYVDAMTKVKNKGAYATAIEELQIQADRRGNRIQFAIGIFDCDDLKEINDLYGHDKGDEYLKTACQLICRVFRNSPVYRIGGDEFSVILQHDDYQNREVLRTQFDEAAAEINRMAKNPWDEVHLSYGFADYTELEDNMVVDTMRRADRTMYDNKHTRKKSKKKQIR
jgi:diguanylate cyclase (GGDEF)-like protein